jgi:hypothetical protein
MSTIHCAPDLVEEAVFLFMTQSGGTDPVAAATWRREREPLYLSPPGVGRERAFQGHARAWFERLGLSAPIEAALRSCPRVSAGLSAIEVRRVVRARDVGSEVFGAAGAARADPKRMILGLQPHRFLDAAALEALVLCELLHADDMLDPDFGFDPDLDAGPEADPARRELVRDRFRVLWTARVQGRLARRSDPHASPPPADPSFRLAFGRSADSDAVEGLFREAWSGGLATYDELLDRACCGCGRALASSSPSPP